MVDKGLDGLTNAEDEVTLTYTVTNTGNTCLGKVVVDDPPAGTLQCTADYSGIPDHRNRIEEEWNDRKALSPAQ